MLEINANVRRYHGGEKQGGESDCMMTTGLAICVRLVCVCACVFCTHVNVDVYWKCAGLPVLSVFYICQVRK